MVGDKKEAISETIHGFHDGNTKGNSPAVPPQSKFKFKLMLNA